MKEMIETKTETKVEKAESKEKRIAVKKIDTEQFVKMAREVHGEKYDYSKTAYVNSRTKVGIICPVHGEFSQSPVNHLHGAGCPMCNGNAKMDAAEFIRRARKVHGEKYGYEGVRYVNNAAKVRIVCPVHGEFWQAPHVHLYGHGCPRCGGARKMTTEDFIRMARKVHGEKYGYEGVRYVNMQTPVRIVCPVHGEFFQRPVNHLHGSSCAACSREKRKRG